MPRGGAGLRNHGATDGRSRRRPAGYVLHGRARWVTAEWNDMDVHADERLPFGALAEVDLPPAKRCPVSIWRTPDRTRINRPNPARLELMIGRCDRQANKIACAPKSKGRQRLSPRPSLRSPRTKLVPLTPRRAGLRPCLESRCRFQASRACRPDPS